MDSIGGMVVVGVVTGGHFIKDIQITVPHRIAVHIPADKMLKSKDLYRDLQTGAIMKLAGDPVFPSHGTVGQDGGRVEALEQEKAQLKMAESEGVAALQKSLTSLEAQMERVLGALAKIADRPATTSVVHVGGSLLPTGVSEVVGGETPMFLPDNILPKDAEVHLQVQKDISSEGGISGATSKLRELRKKAGSS